MKKICYLLAFVAVGFTACQKQPIVGLGGSASSEVKTLNITLQGSDYTILGKTNYSYYPKFFYSDADAKLYIPTILNSKYAQLSNGSTANVTFAEQPLLVDSIFADEKYTLVTTPTNDYKLLPGNTFSDFSIAQTISWLPYKFTTPPAAPATSQQEILTFAWYNGQSTIAGSVFAFVYVNGAWVQAYLLSTAQYAAVNHPAFSQFTSADDANLPSYFNATLKADPNVMATVKVGSIQYVSFNYYNAAKATTQRIMAMAWNGTNWTNLATNTLAFVKSGGTWIPDPTVYYTLTHADITNIVVPANIGGSALASANTSLGTYFDFETVWTPAYLDQAMILVLQHDFPSPTPNINYKVSFLYYTGGVDVTTTYTFSYNGSTWVAAQ